MEHELMLGRPKAFDGQLRGSPDIDELLAHGLLHNAGAFLGAPYQNSLHTTAVPGSLAGASSDTTDPRVEVYLGPPTDGGVESD